MSRLSNLRTAAAAAVAVAFCYLAAYLFFVKMGLAYDLDDLWVEYRPQDDAIIGVVANAIFAPLSELERMHDAYNFRLTTKGTWANGERSVILRMQKGGQCRITMRTVHTTCSESFHVQLSAVTGSLVTHTFTTPGLDRYLIRFITRQGYVDVELLLRNEVSPRSTIVHRYDSRIQLRSRDHSHDAQYSP